MLSLLFGEQKLLISFFKQHEHERSSRMFLDLCLVILLAFLFYTSFIIKKLNVIHDLCIKLYIYSCCNKICVPFYLLYRTKPFFALGERERELPKNVRCTSNNIVWLKVYTKMHVLKPQSYFIFILRFN